MIVPMRQYRFWVHDRDYEAFLAGLQELGVAHLRELRVDWPEEREAYLRSRQIAETALRKLRQRAPAPDADPAIDPPAHPQAVLDLLAEQERLAHERQLAREALDALAPWGNFSPERLRAMAERGLSLRLLRCDERKFRPEWSAQLPLEIIGRQSPWIYFVVAQLHGEPFELAGAEECPLPDESPDALRRRLAALDEALAQTHRALDAHARYHLDHMEANLHQTNDQLALLEARAHTEALWDGRVCALTGFVPTDKEALLADYCARSGVFAYASTPTPDDAPPVLLKNNAFSRLFEPIGQLFSLPAYAEMDLTPFFAPFFMLFFGFCLGDAAYGLAMLLGAWWYGRRAAPALRPYLRLARWLGAATVFFGLLTGTFLGYSLAGDNFAWLGGLRRYMLDSEQTFNLALALGGVQIVFALALQAFNRWRQFGGAYALPPIGWILLLSGIAAQYALGLAGAAALALIWSGVALVLLFSAPGAGWGARLGMGLWELYGITGFFGDLLSYIRLFALGISSAILGFVINNIAGQFREGFGWAGIPLFVVFMVVGHTANLLIAALGAFVHPMRLTFVEFYKNAGFAGGGKPYKPLSKSASSSNIN